MSMSVYLSASRNEETYPDKCKIGYALSLWGMYRVRQVLVTWVGLT